VRESDFSATFTHFIERFLFITAEYLYMTMSGDERGGETFLAKVYKGWRVTIYEPIRESLGLEVGDRVRVTIRKDEANR